MNTIRNTYISSLLADATYSLDLVDGLRSAALVNALSPRMTPTLAQFISSKFEVVAQHQGSESNCAEKC